MEKIIKTIKLIAIYARVSTAKQEEEQTIKNQLDALRTYAKENGYTIVEEYIDEGWSGDILMRPSLDKLRQDAKNKVWDAVLIYDPDRLARRYSYQELVMDELREGGVEVMFITISTPKNSEDKILYGVRGLFAEYERAKISERFRLGKLRKVREGHILVSEPLYGYNYIPKQDGRHGYYEINPEEMRVVKMIFIWIAGEGMTLRGVVRKLQELGIKPRKSKRGVWSTSTLTTMLRNKAYIGKAHWGSSYAVVPENPFKVEKYKKIKKTSRRIKPEKDWIASDIPVPVIIDEKLFYKVRERLEINFKLCKRNRKNEYLLAGKIRCECGRARGGEGAMRGKHLYYRCSDRVSSFPLPHKCKEKGINARIADKMVWRKVSELMSSPELLLKQINRFVRARKTKNQVSFNDTTVLVSEIKKLKKEEERYSKAYGKGVFTIEQLQEYTIPIKERIMTLENQIEKADKEKRQISVDILPDKSEIEMFAKKATMVLQNLNFLTKRGILLDIIGKVIGTQQHLQVTGSISINNNVVFKTSHRNCWSAECREKHAF